MTVQQEAEREAWLNREKVTPNHRLQGFGEILDDSPILLGGVQVLRKQLSETKQALTVQQKLMHEQVSARWSINTQRLHDRTKCAYNAYTPIVFPARYRLRSLSLPTHVLSKLRPGWPNTCGRETSMALRT